MKRVIFSSLLVFFPLISIIINPPSHTYAYNQGTCGSSTSICYTGTAGQDMAPGYACGSASGYVYGTDGAGHVLSCLDGLSGGLCCDPGSPKPPLPPHNGFDLGTGTPPCAQDSICYTGDYNLDHLYPGAQCGTLKDWHFGTAGSIVPNCGISAHCCDAGSSATVTPVPTAPPPPCNTDGQNNCVSVNTSFGTIPTNLTGMISSAFGILLSFTGGILLIIIVISGYRIMTSQGDPEKIKGVKETLTAAIVGFVFIIFAVAILAIIGVDILRIPGFTK